MRQFPLHPARQRVVERHNEGPAYRFDLSERPHLRAPGYGSSAQSQPSAQPTLGDLVNERKAARRGE